MIFLFKYVILLLILVLYEKFYTVYLPETCENHYICHLIIADPQLVGKEFYNAIDNIAMWDSDNYMRKYYKAIYNKILPEYILFLGDIFDQGSIMDDKDFFEHFQRFLYVFGFQKQYMIIDGDNDVTERNTYPSRALTRFNKVFNNSLDHSVINLAKITTLDFYSLYDYAMSVAIQYTDGKMQIINQTILLSHYTILDRHPRFVETIMQIYKPNLILSGDTHKSQIFRIPINNQTLQYSFKHLVTSYESPAKAQKFIISPHQPYVYEINVPTFNYRMGTPKIGCGLLRLHPQKNHTEILVEYEVIWLPDRFKQLYTYLIIFILLVLYDITIFLSKHMRISSWFKRSSIHCIDLKIN